MCVCVCVCVQYFPLESIQLFMTTTIREHIVTIIIMKIIASLEVHYECVCVCVCVCVCAVFPIRKHTTVYDNNHQRTHKMHTFIRTSIHTCT